MVPVNERSHGGSQSNSEAQSEACGPKACEPEAEAWPACLDGARAGGVRSGGCGFRRRRGARSSGCVAALPFSGRWIDGDRSRFFVEGHEEGGEETFPGARRTARHAGDAGVDREARRCSGGRHGEPRLYGKSIGRSGGRQAARSRARARSGMQAARLQRSPSV